METKTGNATISGSSGISSCIPTDTTRLAYTHCETRIINLQDLKLPTDPSTPDLVFRDLYKTYTTSSTGGIDLESRAEWIRNIRSAVTSLTTGISPPVAFPTETVYGLGADATNAGSIAGIFAAKGRPSDNPLIVHVSSTAHLERCLGGTESQSAIPEVYRDLVREFWPGPLTILIPVPEKGKGVQFAANVHPGQKTIGFRVPSSPYARLLLSITDRPIAAPSANSSGKPSPTTARHVADDLNGKINFILDGGSCDVGVESTVVDGLSEPPVILRPGGLSRSALRTWGKRLNNVWQFVENGWEDKTGIKRKRGEDGEVNGSGRKSSRVADVTDNLQNIYDSPATRSPAGEQSTLQQEHDGSAAPRAPGMKYKHYAPTGRMFLFEASSDPSMNSVQRVHDKIRELLRSRDTTSFDTGTEVVSGEAGTAPRSPHTLKIGLLTSTSWSQDADHRDSLLKQIFSDWGYEDLGEYTNPQLTQDSGRTHDVEIDPGRKVHNGKHVSIKSIELGRDPVTVAQNLFAALRTCDKLECEWIFVEAPSRARAIDVSSAPLDRGSEVRLSGNDEAIIEGKVNRQDADEDKEDGFETVLERMRKAASEVIRS